MIRFIPGGRKNPEFAFAFKMVLSDQMAEAKVIDVLWTPSKDGFLKPVIQIEPVRIKGADIEYATAYNAKFIADNKIGIGALVKMVRSGDVIPKIMEVVKASRKAKMPKVPWKWNASHVDALLIDSTNHPVVLLKNIAGFFAKLNVVGLGRGNVKRIIAAGFKSVPAILKMSKDDFLKVEGFKEKMATKVYASIHTQLKEVELPVLMAATNIFGRGMGPRRMREILKAFPKILTSSASKASKSAEVASLNGFADKTAKAFVEYIPAFIAFVKETNLQSKLKAKKQKKFEKKQEKQAKKHPLYEKRIVMTGFRDKELSEQLTKLGANVSNSVSKNTFMVLVKDMGKKTSNIRKAGEYKIPIMTPQDFRKKYL